MYNKNKRKKKKILNIFINIFYIYIINFMKTIKLINMKIKEKKIYFYSKTLLFKYLFSDNILFIYLRIL